MLCVPNMVMVMVHGQHQRPLVVSRDTVRPAVCPAPVIHPLTGHVAASMRIVGAVGSPPVAEPCERRSMMDKLS